MANSTPLKSPAGQSPSTKEASLRESRLHDARHTAATVLLLLEVLLRTVMSIMGWSSVDMVALPAPHRQHPSEGGRASRSGDLANDQRARRDGRRPARSARIHPAGRGHRPSPQRRRRPSRPRGSHRSPPRGPSGRSPEQQLRRKLRRAAPMTKTSGTARFLFLQLRALAEDKRFELLRVSPTRFPSVRPRPLGESSVG
jgi:hypothetical protein